MADDTLSRLFPDESDADTVGFLFVNRDDAEVQTILAARLSDGAKKAALKQRIQQLKGIVLYCCSIILVFVIWYSVSVSTIHNSLWMIANMSPLLSSSLV